MSSYVFTASSNFLSANCWRAVCSRVSTALGAVATLPVADWPAPRSPDDEAAAPPAARGAPPQPGEPAKADDHGDRDRRAPRPPRPERGAGGHDGPRRAG